MEDIKEKDFETLVEEESLFLAWADVLLEHSRSSRDSSDPTYIWFCAKEYALGIADSRSPVIMFKKKCYELEDDFQGAGFGDDYSAALAIGCLYTMLVLSARDRMQKIAETIPLEKFIQKADVRETTQDIVKQIYEDKITCDYDYTRSDGGLVTEEEPVTEPETGPLVEKPHDKVRLEIMKQLLEKSGLDLRSHGNKAEAARLVNYLTNMSDSACKNYFSSPVLNRTTHKDEIMTVNMQLKKLGISWLL